MYSGNDEFCSLEKSRIARNLVEAHILTPLAAIGYDIPMTCPFHPKLVCYLSLCLLFVVDFGCY